MKGKKPTCTLLVAILILATTMVSVGADTQLTKLFVDPPTYTATQLGEVFTININIINAQNLAGYQFNLSYNTTLLDAMDAVEGPFPQPPIDCLVKINEPEGHIQMMVICGPTEGNGTLATITFNATYAGSASCALHLYDTELADINGEPITHEVEHGKYEFRILSLTVTTDKPFYHLEENIEINANLTLDSSPGQGLVALGIHDPKDSLIIARTLQVGVIPPGNITIVEVVPCDSGGTPKDSFKTGTLAHFNVTIENSGTEWKNVVITFNVYDANIFSLGTAWGIVPVGPGIHPGLLIKSFPIPDWACTGAGMVYAGAFTDWPDAGGVPYCPEKSATFNITGSTLGTETMEAKVSENVGNHSLTFKLAYNAKAGNYTVYAGSSYRGTATSAQVTNKTTFEVKLIGDVDGDGEVTVSDMLVLKVALTKIMLGIKNETELLAENPFLDITGDGEVTVSDMLVLKVVLTKIMLGLI